MEVRKMYHTKRFLHDAVTVYICNGCNGFWVEEPDDDPNQMIYYTCPESGSNVYAIGKRLDVQALCATPELLEIDFTNL
jgi:hypothetical protein